MKLTAEPQRVKPALSARPAAASSVGWWVQPATRSISPRAHSVTNSLPISNLIYNNGCAGTDLVSLEPATFQALFKFR